MNYTLVLSADQLNLVLGALGELPAKTSISLIMEIQKQAQVSQQGPASHEHSDEE